MNASVREQLLALVLAARDDVRSCRVELATAPAPLQRMPQDAPQPAPPAPAATPAATPATVHAPAPQPVLRVGVARLRA